MFSIIILLSLATWRLSSLIRDEAGPYDMFGKFRDWAGVVEIINPVSGDRELFGNGNLLSDIIHCFWCLSVWVGGIVCAIAVILSIIQWQEFIFYALATSAIAIMFETKVFKEV